jgi:hypothetical protein
MSRIQSAGNRATKRVIFRTRDDAFAALQKAMREENRIEQSLDRQAEQGRDKSGAK